MLHSWANSMFDKVEKCRVIRPKSHWGYEQLPLRVIQLSIHLLDVQLDLSDVGVFSPMHLLVFQKPESKAPSNNSKDGASK